jgi:hypothetical protein
VRRRYWMGAMVLVAPLLDITAVSAHPNVDPGTVVSPPSGQSTSGDYATDVFGDPWDFSNDEDVPPIPLVGSENGAGISRDSGGNLNVATVQSTTVKLVRTWGVELPWGRDGLLHPVDAGRYTRLSFSMCLSARRNMGVHFFTSTGEQGLVAMYPEAGCRQYTIDLLDRSLYPFAGLQAAWAGKVVRLELLAGGAFTAGNPVINLSLDWVRLHRADAPVAPPSGVPIARVLSPSAEGGADYATVTGNPWDYTSMADIASMDDIANVNFGGGDLHATSVGNDPFVEFPLPAPFVTDRYHRATIDVCYEGAMGFAHAPGGGMNARFAWLPVDGPAWSETQDIIIYPGCNRMTVDLATNPAVAVNDENTTYKFGWRGQQLERFRFDIDEDPGARNFVLREIKLADDAAFSDAYNITFLDAAGAGGTVADIYATTNDGAYDGVKIASGLTVTGGVNTFTWTGKDATGKTMPNGTYSIWISMRNGNGVSSSYASGPVRIERPMPATPSYFVPINPVRVLDTRTGEGGNVVPLGGGIHTELDVTGVAGLPETGMTAVVMNVAVDQPTAAGFLTAWPSGEARPLVASLNFLPGQTVPNLVTVKVGANGKVDIFNSAGQTSVIADVMGYYTDSAPPGGGRFTSLTPSRILDTRDGTGRGGVAAPISAGTSIDVPVTGVGGVPSSGVSGVALNVTVTDPTSAGFLSAWPAGEPRPFTATHNFVPNLTIGNLVLAKVGTNGRVSIYNSSGLSHVVADVVGYFSASGGAFLPVQPTRLLDTRDGTGGVLGQIGPDGSVSVTLANGNPVPANATAVIVNVTSVSSSQPSYITAWPTGTARPLAATMNPRPGVPVPNQAYLKLGTDGKLSLYNYQGSTDVVIDLFGYIR